MGNYRRGYRVPDDGKAPQDSLAWCETCGKWWYATRKVARSRGKVVFPGGRLRAYRCPDRTDWWHIGRLGPAVVRGVKTADEVYRRKRKAEG